MVSKFKSKFENMEMQIHKIESKIFRINLSKYFFIILYIKVRALIIIIIMIIIVPIVIGALGAITKGLLKSLEDLEVGGRIETIQTTAWLRTARILRRVLET